ncbi:sensor histidine kinase [Streptomyces griseocarneus]|uniref:sensor histidine kinase n=1 Tax=Streptomyces griseocarneus TaxID=51201 RepID=UPI00167E82F4|nr:histidine kinase [Streptomyces griseocarneus]MBZ6476076.1 histidine kinase [Streptomyces griseocarneus]GHG77480.1 histidine kinase [Streptomyces griseocarneus]
MTTTGAIAEAGARGAPVGPWWWVRRRSLVLDAVLAVVSALECALEGVSFAQEAGLPGVLGGLVGLPAGTTLLLRRRWPVAVVLVSIAILPAEMGVLLGIVSMYTLAASEVPRRIIAVLAGASLVGTLIVTFARFHKDMAQDGYRPGFWLTWVFSLVMALGLTAPPVLLGLYVGARRRLVESLRERADGLERELSLLADRAEERAVWARNEERTRIAREMHDVVAHRVSLMVVHAAALQAVALKDPEKASRNAALVGDMGRQALTELREMLGVLRSGSDAGVRPPGAVESERLAAVATAASARVRVAAGAAGAGGGGVVDAGDGGPCLDGLGDLVGQSRDAGMAVELSVMGEERAYAPEVEQTAYRVVQEALTNVHKHAPGAKALVRLAHREAEVALQVENGPSDAGADAGPGLPSGGNGLVGMRERVAALGGVFVSGPTDAGGFRVSAVIPDTGVR